MPHLHALILRTSTLSGFESSSNLSSNNLSQHGCIFFSVTRLQFFLSLSFGILDGLVSLRSSLTLHFPCRVGSTLIYSPLAGSTMATGYLAVHFCVAFNFFPPLPRDCAQYMHFFLVPHSVYKNVSMVINLCSVS
ncbi:hypothetical protein K435DRAFT_364404 [Dendrothele bispora CBS 962.96]|uniref:Uncharacterized protein n=1 Tax=Dendrothele bispora (strain CBS 962.96) TaxID=1314807 RepID=A0A4S8LCR1_DENBC|nr:hypothetical protein K435DRAFT_364404 [Dendrothele bispora CBS 962.96]